MFFINITCGLALISQEKTILSHIGLAGSLAIIASLTAAFNSIGRFGYSTLSDKVKDRGSIYAIIFLSSALLCTFVHVFAFNNSQTILGMLVIGCLIGCNAGYGGGFSTLPSLLSDDIHSATWTSFSSQRWKRSLSRLLEIRISIDGDVVQ